MYVLNNEWLKFASILSSFVSFASISQVHRIIIIVEVWTPAISWCLCILILMFRSNVCLVSGHSSLDPLESFLAPDEAAARSCLHLLLHQTCLGQKHLVQRHSLPCRDSSQTETIKCVRQSRMLACQSTINRFISCVLTTLPCIPECTLNTTDTTDHDGVMTGCTGQTGDHIHIHAGMLTTLHHHYSP